MDTNSSGVNRKETDLGQLDWSSSRHRFFFSTVGIALCSSRWYLGRLGEEGIFWLAELR